MWLAITALDSGTGIEGKFWYTAPGDTAAFVEASLPTGVSAIARRPSFADYTGDGESRVYIVGAHCDNLVFTENCQIFRQGIAAPINPFTTGAGTGFSIGVVAAAAVGTGRTGSCVCYISWYDKVHNRRSPLSGPSDAITLTAQGIAWTNLPTAPADGDPSVTDIELWVSMDGLTARLACRRDLGVTAVTEEVPTLSLGEAFDEDFERFPVCRYNCSWHDRQVMAGDQRFPDRIYFSTLLKYERYGGLYLRTRRGERVTGLYVVRDNLFVTTDKSHYIVTGYTEDDIKMEIFEPAIGSICHAGVQNVGELAFVPTQMGIFINTGSALQSVSHKFARTWANEYENNRNAYELGFAVVRPQESTYKFCPYGVTINDPDTPLTKYWVLDYSGMEGLQGGGFTEPQLSYDYRGRIDTCAAQLAYPDGRRSDVFTGSYDGFIRREGYTAIATPDDSDDYGKQMIVKHKHYFFDEVTGTPDGGYTWQTFWSFIVSEGQDATLNLYFGDESAGDAASPDYTETIPAGEKSVVDGAYTYYYVQRTKHMSQPNMSGAGITVEVKVAIPDVGVSWRGFGGTRTPGPNNRGIYSIQGGG